MEKRTVLQKGQDAYLNGNEDQRKLLVSIFGNEVIVKPLRETVKTVADVCRQSGKTFKINARMSFKKKVQIQLDLVESIFEVFREGKKVDTGDTTQRKWYPYFKVVKDEKAPAGFRLAFDDATYNYDLAHLGARPGFVVFSEADAIHIGKAFEPEITKLFQYENLAQ